jgi:hypothetical protein
MTTPRTPDSETLWSTPDDETATEWLRLVDSFTDGFLVEPGEHTEDPAQVVFLLYLLAWTCREKTNFLVFEPHKERLAEVLERWSVPLGGSASPRYPFWRLQQHRFWRLMSWGECCEMLDLPRSEHARFRTDASVGVLDERAWLAMMTDDLLLHNVVTSLTTSYWQHSCRDIERDLGLPDGSAPVLLSGRHTNHANMAKKPGTRPTPRFERNRTYAAGELCELLELPTTPEECSFAHVKPGTTALLISDSSWHLAPSTDGHGQEIHWPFSNRRYDNWLVLAELSDADRLLVFTQESSGPSYRYRGAFELVSLEQRRWSLIRRIHDVVMREVFN